MASNEELARIYGAYLGSEVMQFHKLKGVLIGVSKLYATVQFDGSKTSAWDMFDCQLLLRPLSDISDEDAIEVAKIILSGLNEPITPKICTNIDYSDNVAKAISIGGDGVLFIAFNEKIGFTMAIVDPYEEQTSVPFATYVIDFLRSKSYDIGFGSIPSLITAGIAKREV